MLIEPASRGAHAATLSGAGVSGQTSSMGLV